MTKLTDRIVKSLKPPPKGYTVLWDSEVHGLGVRTTSGGASFIFNYRTRAGRLRRLTIGKYPAWSVIAAREAAKQHRRNVDTGGDPIADRERERENTREQYIIERWSSFIAQGVEPGCCLYRAYHPDGDLLYVGISLEPLSRLRQHQKGTADWRHLIFRIVIEPFATREEALEAERLAIKTEFPKFNAVHNRRRDPHQELAKLSDAEKEVRSIHADA